MFSSQTSFWREEEQLAIKTTKTTHEVAVRVSDLSKCYHIYDRPQDRLKQSILPRIQHLMGRAPRQYHRDFWALRGVSLEVRRGETVGIIGRNGSGKSTLLQLICGTLSPTHGTIETNGRIAALLELGSGFNPEFTGRENVYMNAAVLGLDRDEIDSRFEQITAFADIGQFIDQPLKTYSSGMAVRLAFAVSVCIDPDILVVDEALSVGDEAFQRKCYARIEQIQERGGTILFVSHAAQTIVQLCNRAILIDAGEKLLEGRAKTVVSQYQRLVHAPADRAAAVRSAIQAAVEMAEEGQPDSQPQDNYDTKPERTTSLAAFLADDLPSPSTVTYEPDGAEISDVHIATLNGERVNHLIHGDAYVLRYTVTFSETAEHVNFASLLKTPSGVEIAGQVTAPGAAGIKVKAGQTLTVAFYFDALFLPGSYFCNAGVFSHQDGDFRQLHRVIDALMFRVLPSESISTLFGIMSLRHKPARIVFATST